ncbi:uncharacterized protein LOC134539574 [Bacillus rossius redtenbacheri]|uniref:uncharacterized protein LOC134539574 n=1 Tax=Bacillus rossius redtenbacheri TaxID=93214 RepID=UPI002FDD2A1D
MVKMTRKKPCCVPGCRDTTSIRHRLPKNDDVSYKIWLERINNPRLLSLDKERVYKTYVVCERHFIDDCKNLGSKHLKIYSLPSLHLPNFTEVGTVNNSFGYPRKGSYNGIPSCEKDISELPCKARADTLQKASNEHNSQIQAMDVDRGIEDNIDSCSLIEKQGQETATNTMDISFFESDGVWPLDTVDLQMNEETGNQMADATIRNEHSGSRLKNRNNSLLKKTGTTRQMKLTPKAQKLYSEATKLLRQKRCLSLRVKQYKTRVKLAEKFSESSFFDNLINKVDLVTYNFIMSQIRTQKHKPKGRRFTLNDKIFALSVLKQSPKGYKLLSKYFSLPSKRLLNNLLQKLDFKPGINMRVMAHLKETVTKLNQKDRYCCLMFDEMSLHPNIQYMVKVLTG